MEPQIAEYGFAYAVTKGSLKVADPPFAASLGHFSLVDHDDMILVVMMMR